MRKGKRGGRQGESSILLVHNMIDYSFVLLTDMTNEPSHQLISFFCSLLFDFRSFSVSK